MLKNCWKIVKNIGKMLKKVWKFFEIKKKNEIVLKNLVNLEKNVEKVWNMLKCHIISCQLQKAAQQDK